MSNKNEKRRAVDPSVKLSKSLCWALRHQGPQIGLSMTPDGYVPVSQILHSKHSKLKGPWTLDDIEHVVNNNDKQRFKISKRPADNYPDVQNDNGEDTILCIRATQGHSLKFIDQDLLLEPIHKEELAKMPIIVHGTYRHSWRNGIQNEGLKRMSRNHIHFAEGLPNKEVGVISGMRRTCEIFIYLDAKKCAKSSALTFYRSENGVILTAGVDGEGTLPVEFFSHVTDRDGNVLFDERSEVQQHER